MPYLDARQVTAIPATNAPTTSAAVPYRGRAEERSERFSAASRVSASCRRRTSVSSVTHDGSGRYRPGASSTADPPSVVHRAVESRRSGSVEGDGSAAALWERVTIAAASAAIL